MVFALPLLFALIGLVADGSNLFANKRSVQNAADGSVLAAVRELNGDLTLCGGPDTTPGTCLYRVRTTAEDYSKRNDGPSTLHLCDDASGPDPGPCYLTPYPRPGDYGGLQVRLRKKIPLNFGGVLHLSDPWVGARAAAGLSLPSGAGNVSPVAIQTTKVCHDPSCFNTGPGSVTLDFGANFDSTEYVLLDLNPPTPGSSPVPCSNEPVGNPNGMNTYIRNGFPGILPVNAWYSCNNNDKTQKNGIKQAFMDFAQRQPEAPLLVPVFNVQDATTSSVHVVGFAAFLIDPNNGITWTGNTHTLTGQFVTFIATGVGGGGCSTPPCDFGVHVVTLSE